MAQPEELKSAYGQRPESLSKNKEQNFPEDDFVLPLGAIDNEDTDIVPMDAAMRQDAGLAPRPNIPSFWTGQPVPSPTVQESVDQLKGLGAEVAGGASAMATGAGAGALIGGGIGALLGGPAAPITAAGGVQLGSAIGAFLGGAVGTKTAVNFFRETFGLQPEEDRNAILDAVFSVPALQVGKAIGPAASAALKSEKYIASIVEKNLTGDQKQIWTSIKSGIAEAANDVGGEKLSNDIMSQINKDIGESLQAGNDLNSSIRFAADKAGASIDHVKKFDEITSMFGGSLTDKELAGLAKGEKTLRTSPGEALKALGSEYRAEWNAAVGNLQKNAELFDNVDLTPALDDLKALQQQKEFGKEYQRQIKDAISAIENSNAVQKSRIVEQSATPGGERMIILDASGAERPMSSSAFSDEARKQKMIAIDKLINLRQSYDQSPLAKGAITGKKQATLDVVQNLRRVEDSALQALASSDDAAVSELGKNAIAAKGRVASHLAEMKKLGKIGRGDSISYANVIESDTATEKAGALLRALKDYPETRGAVMSTMLNNKLSGILKPSQRTGITKNLSDAMLELSNDSLFINKLETLGQDMVSKGEIQRKIKSYADILSRASKSPNKSIANNVATEATSGLMQFFISRGINMNPMTWLGAIAPSNPVVAQRTAMELFRRNPDVMIESMMTTPGEVAKSVRFFESLLGVNAAPIVSKIAERAGEYGMQSTLVAPMKMNEQPVAPSVQ